jgi:hypothetical protein
MAIVRDSGQTGTCAQEFNFGIVVTLRLWGPAMITPEDPVWQLCERVTREQDPQRLMELTKKILQALDAEQRAAEQTRQKRDVR